MVVSPICLGEILGRQQTLEFLTQRLEFLTLWRNIIMFVYTVDNYSRSCSEIMVIEV